MKKVWPSHSVDPYPLKYPRLTKLGLAVEKDGRDGIPYVKREPLIAALTKEGLLEKWNDWAVGTCSGHGIYPHDVEDFLAEKPNTD